MLPYDPALRVGSWHSLLNPANPAARTCETVLYRQLALLGECSPSGFRMSYEYGGKPYVFTLTHEGSGDDRCVQASLVEGDRRRATVFTDTQDYRGFMGFDADIIDELLSLVCNLPPAAVPEFLDIGAIRSASATLADEEGN